MGYRSVKPSDDHKALMLDLRAALGKHTHLSGLEMLACVSQLVGNLVAFQDQRALTPEQAMEIVSRNIQEGNEVAIANLSNVGGHA